MRGGQENLRNFFADGVPLLFQNVIELGCLVLADELGLEFRPARSAEFFAIALLKSVSVAVSGVMTGVGPAPRAAGAPWTAW